MENPFSIIDQRLENIERCLSKLMSAIESQSKNDKYSVKDSGISFNIIELAKYLGVTKSTIFRYKKNQVFPFHQVGRTIYFKKSDVDCALSSSKKK
jgi:excisionase family DNA binding protein